MAHHARVDSADMAASKLAATLAEKDVIEAAKEAFVCPPGYRRCVVPTGESRSCMYDYGVKVEEIEPTSEIPTDPSKRRKVNGRFFCLASKRCRDGRVGIKISNMSTSPASEHLNVLHGVVSRKAAQIQRIKDANVAGASPPRERASSSAAAPTALAAAPKSETPPLPPPAHPAVTPKTYSSKGNGHSADDVELSDAERERSFLLDYVKTHTILGFEPLDYMEHEARRQNTMILLSPTPVNGGVPSLVAKLHSKQLKKGLVELYDATKNVFARDLAADARAAPIAAMHLCVDRWTAHGITFIGARVSYLTEDFRLKTNLIAVNQYTPSREVRSDSHRAGELIRAWTGQVLEEYGLDWSMLLHTVTDGSPEMRAAFGESHGSCWRETCIPHTLNRVIIDGFGLSRFPGKCENPAARSVIMAVRKILRDVQSSPEMLAAFDDLREDRYRVTPENGPRQAAAREWLHTTAAMERFLVLLPSLRSYFKEQELCDFPFDSEDELLELYTLLKSLSGVIEACQSATAPSAPTAMQHMLLLLASDLNCSNPLELHEPSHYFSGPSAQAAAPAWVDAAKEGPAAVAAKSARMVKAPEDLTEVGRITRTKVREELFKLFGLERWGKGYERESHVFDMVLALHPGCRQLHYMDKISESPDEVSKIKAKVWAQVQRLVEEVIVHERAVASSKRGNRGVPAAAPDNSTAADGVSATPSTAEAFAAKGSSGSGRGDSNGYGNSHKRVRVTPKSDEKSREMLDAMTSAGLFDPQAMFDSEEEGEQEQSPAEEAKEAVSAWRTAKLPSADRFINTNEGLLGFWRGYGKKSFRIVSVVARSVLGAPGHAAVLDNDFNGNGTGGGGGGGGGWASANQGCRDQVMIRENIDPTSYGEMIMFLRASFAIIPENIPQLSVEQVKRAIPIRLWDHKRRREVEDLCPTWEDSEYYVGVGLTRLEQSLD